MRFLFVFMESPSHCLEAPHFSQGVGSLSAVLKAAGHKTDLLKVGDFLPHEIDEKLDDFSPDVVGISSTSGFAQTVRQVVAHLRKSFDGPVILGGVHATVAPEDAISIPGIAAIVRGEAEYALLDLVEAIEKGKDYSNILNLWVKNGKTVKKNDIRNRIENLDELPFPDRELFDYDEILRVNPVAEFLCSRGCIFRCAHCINRSWNDLYKGKGRVIRFRSVDNVIREIKQVRDRYPRMRLIEFHDDTITIDKQWLKEFSARYAEEINIPFACNSRPGTVDDEIVSLLKEANCTEVRMGIECGNDYVRNVILRRNLTKKQIVRDFQRFRSVGIRIWAFNMIGLPFETETTIQETIGLNKLIRPDFAQVSVFFPFPGTEAHQICKERGWISNRSVGSFYENDTILDQPGLTRKQVGYYNRIFRWETMYPKWSPLIKLLCLIPAGRNRVLYDLLFPFFKKFYRQMIKYRRDISGDGGRREHEFVEEGTLP